MTRYRVTLRYSSPQDNSLRVHDVYEARNPSAPSAIAEAIKSFRFRSDQLVEIKVEPVAEETTVIQ